MTWSASASCGMAVGRDEAGRLDLGQAGGAQQRDVFELGLGRDGRRFVLQTVSRPDLVDAHARRQRHGRSLGELDQRFPALDLLPGPTSTESTRPAAGALTVFSIFIASSTSNTWPAAT